MFTVTIEIIIALKLFYALAVSTLRVLYIVRDSCKSAKNYYACQLNEFLKAINSNYNYYEYLIHKNFNNSSFFNKQNNRVEKFYN